jgi:RND superfamily putative drug exporter
VIASGPSKPTGRTRDGIADVRRLAELIHRRARLTLAATAVLTIVAGVVGAGVVGSLSNGGSSDPSAPSVVAGRQFVAATGLSPQPGVVVLVRTSGPALGPHGRALVERVAGALRSQRAIGRVLSILDAPRTAVLLSRNGRATLVLGFFGAHAPEAASTAAARRVERDLRGLPGVLVGGDQLTFSKLESTISSELPQVELIAFSVLLLLSLIAFRGLVAAALPLMVGAVAVAGSLLIMRALAQVTSLSVYSLNLVTGLGLGLAIDYSLFVVYRYREEAAAHGHCREALQRTLDTAGRTVAFSSLTVSVALLSLLVFPQPMLSSMGIAAALVTVFAAAAALIPLCSALALLGPRINALSTPRLHRARRRAQGPVADGRWYRLARSVMRRPARVALACSVCLLLVGLPALHLHLGSTDSRALAPGSPPRVVESAIAREFPADPADPIVMVVHARADAASAVERYSSQLAQLPDVAFVQSPRQLRRGLWSIEAIPAQLPLSSASQRLVGRTYALRPSVAAAATGVAAGQYDEHLSLRSHIGYALAILAGTTLLVLFTMTGSIALAIKSLLMNLLSLSAAFGALVFVFQDGRLQGLLGYTATGSLEQTNMIILFIIAFGLSTDYGVFLLARIKEAHDTGSSDEEAVATGLERSGRVVTAAALLFCAAVGSLAASSVASLKEFGIGVALAVLIDSTIVRALLVPALMALLGRANWWAPHPLRSLAARTWAHHGKAARKVA